ncbi:hypothetical protein Ndes2526B_g07552 [Nannochloris sp. 'desiccata']
MRLFVPPVLIAFLVGSASAQVPQPQTAEEMQAQLDLSAENLGAFIGANCNPKSDNFTIYEYTNATIGNLTFIQTGTIQNWPVPLLQQLAATRQVLIFDNRGIGYSIDSAPASELTMETMASSTVDFIAALKLGKADIFGWSMGGEIALTMAVLFPDKVGKIMTIGGDLGGPTDISENAPQYVPVLNALSNSSASDEAFLMRLAALFPAWLNDTDLPGIGVCNLMSSFYSLPFDAASGQAIKNQGVAESAFGNSSAIYDRAANITNPVLIINGEEDVSMAPEAAVMIFNQIPGSILVELPEGGHGSLFSYSANGDDTFAKLLNAFSASDDPNDAVAEVAGSVGAIYQDKKSASPSPSMSPSPAPVPGPSSSATSLKVLGTLVAAIVAAAC